MAILKDLIVQGPSRFIGDITGNKSTFTGDVTGNKFITNGGIASLFVKGDGTLDSTTYELPVPVEEVTDAVTSLTCEPNKYYRFSNKVNTLAITLPTITGTVKKTIVLYFTAGLTPDVTFVTSSAVFYSDDFYIELCKTYEVYLTWNGNLWTAKLKEITTLPFNYSKVKYIENTENVVFWSDILVNLDLKLKLDFCMGTYNNGNDGDSCPTVLEYRTGYWTTPVSIMHKLNNFIVQFGSITYNIPFDTKRHVFVINARKVYWDNTLIIDGSNEEFGSGSQNGFLLFARTNRNQRIINSETYSHLRFYESIINGHQLIPCVRKSDLVYGIYDTFRRYFFSDTTKITGALYEPDAVDLLPASLYSSIGKRGFLYLSDDDKTSSMPLPTAGSTYYIPKLNYNSSGTITTAWENVDTILTAIVNHGTSDTTFELTENRYHKWGSVASLTLTLATPQNSAIMNEYIFSFTSPATPTTLSVPASVNWVTPLDIEPNKLYRVSIIDNLATWITSDMVVPVGDVNTPEYATKAYVDAGLALKEDSSNKVTSVDENSTDTQYPSAKAMYDALNPE